MQSEIITLLASFVLAYLVPELSKLSKWIQSDLDRTLMLRLISAALAFLTAVVGVVLGSGNEAGLKELLESVIIAAVAFFGAFIQHKLVKSVRQ